MYYHVMIESREVSDRLYSIDHKHLEGIIQDVVKPFLQNRIIEFQGYDLEPSKIKRLMITRTEFSSAHYMKISTSSGTYSSLSEMVANLTTMKRNLVTGCFEHVIDITEDVLTVINAKSVSDLEKEVDQANVIENEAIIRKTIFVGYSYRPEDDEFVHGLIELLNYIGFVVIDGKADRLGSISKAIVEKIKSSDVAVIVMNKRDKKENGYFTTSSWLLEEKATAIAFEKQVMMLVEEEIDDSDIGGLQGDAQRISFTRNNFLSKVMNLVKMLEKND